MPTSPGSKSPQANAPADSARQPFERFWIADWGVDPASNQVSRGEQVFSLEPKVMEVLVYLADRAGEVVTRSDLEATVWAETIVGYDSVTRAIQKLRKAFDDDPKQPRVIETLSKRGYRLVAPVHSWGESLESTHTAGGNVKPAQLRNRSMTTRRIFLSALLAIALGLFLWVSSWQTSDDTVVGELIPKSIAVLPFTNMSGDPQQEYFVDGITEDIITDLSNLSDLVVIARNTAFSYKGEETQALKAGKDLGVGYVLEGSVRKSGDHLRITAQLIDTRNGNHIWAERYDRKLVEIFALQDEVTRNIVSKLALTLTTQEKQWLARPATSNFKAYDLFLQGQQNYKQRTKEANGLAKEAYKRAIGLDPGFARAYGALAVVLTIDFRRSWSASPVESLERALVLARKAVALDTASPQAYWSLAFVYLYRKQFNEATDAIEHAIELAPNYADGYGLLGGIYNFRGQAEEAIAYTRKGIKLNPYYTYEYPFNLGRAFYTLERYPEAIAALEDALERNANASFPRLYLAASYVGLGRHDDAEWEIEEIRTLNPHTTLSQLSNTLPLKDPGQLKALLEDLRMAGLPE